MIALMSDAGERCYLVCGWSSGIIAASIHQVVEKPQLKNLIGEVLNMSKSYEVQGVIHSIGDTTEYGNNGFTKREFVVKLTGDDENPRYPNYVAMELIKDNCAQMDNHNVGDEIQAQFNLSGRLWTGNDQKEKCFTSLQAWRISSLSGQSMSSADEGSGYNQDTSSLPPAPPNDDNYDDIPF